MNALSITELKSIAHKANVGVVKDAQDNNGFIIECESADHKDFMIIVCIKHEIEIRLSNVDISFNLENLLGVGFLFYRKLQEIRSEAESYFK